jgi:hypothetical protein
MFIKALSEKWRTQLDSPIQDAPLSTMERVISPAG